MDRSGSHVSLPYKELVEQLSAQFDVPFIEPSSPDNGCTNTIVLFRDSVARLHDPAQVYRTEAYVKVEVAILDALALSLFPCPRVLRTRLGSSLFEWKYGEMIGHGVLLSRCPGISAPDRLLSPTAVGSLLGRLHADLLRNPPSFGEGGSAKAREVKSAKSPSESEDILRTGTLVAQNIRQQSASYAALLDQLVAAAAAPSAVTVEGVVHLDLNRTNFLYDEASETLSLVDFDFAMPGPLLLDVGFALVEYCCNSNHSVFDPDAASAFLRAYNAQRPFVAEELATGLKKHVALVWIRTLTWLWGSPHHWHRPELMQFGERVAPIIVAVLEWDASL